MIFFSAILLYLIGAVLGLWSASLLWRAAHAWRVARRARRERTARAPVVENRRRWLGIGLACVCLPLAGIALACGEVVRVGFLIDADRVDLFVFRAGAAILLLLAAGAAYVGWRFDPAHGRRRCPRCWYDMSGTPGLRCPECGREARSEGGLFRTRRARALWALTLVFLLGAYSLYLAPRVKEKGWTAAIPTTVMIVGLPWLSQEAAHDSEASLESRIADDELWRWQKDLLQWRCRRIISHSRSLLALESAVSFVQEQEEQLTFCPEGQLRVIEAYCAESTSGSRSSSESNYYLLSCLKFLPDQVDETIDGAASAEVCRALSSSDSVVRSWGIFWAGRLGAGGVQLVPRLREIASDGSEDYLTRDPAVVSLGRLGSRIDSALEVYLGTFASDVERTRWKACNVAPEVSGRSEVVRPYLIRALDDPSDWVCTQAALSLIKLATPACELVARLALLAEARPVVRHGIVFALAQACPNEQVVSMVENLLRSGDAGDQLDGAMAATQLGAGGERLLPLLRAFAKYEGASDRDIAAANAVRVIEDALGTTEGPAPESKAKGKSHPPE